MTIIVNLRIIKGLSAKATIAGKRATWQRFVNMSFDIIHRVGIDIIMNKYAFYAQNNKNTNNRNSYYLKNNY